MPTLAWRPAALLAIVCSVPCCVGAGRRPAASDLRIRGGGNGHGIGMSQYGADGYALHGKSYRSILAHYYHGTTLGQADPPTGPCACCSRAPAEPSFSGATTGRQAAAEGERDLHGAPNADGNADPALDQGHGQGPQADEAGTAHRRRSAFPARRRCCWPGSAPTAARSCSGPTARGRRADGRVGRARGLRARRDLGRDAGQLAAAGAQGPGGGGADLRDHHRRRRRRLRPLSRHPLADVRRRGARRPRPPTPRWRRPRPGRDVRGCRW